MPHIAPFFPKNAFSARVDSCEGWQSRAARERTPKVYDADCFSPKDQFANSTNVDDKRRGFGVGTEASKVRSDESRAQESWALWKRGVALRGSRILRQGSTGTASLYLKLKGNSKYRPLAQSDELSITSFPLPRPIVVLNRVLRSSFAVVSFALSSRCDLFLSRKYCLFSLLLKIFKLFKLKLFSIFTWVVLKESFNARVSSAALLWKFYAILSSRSEHNRSTILALFSWTAQHST